METLEIPKSLLDFRPGKRGFVRMTTGNVLSQMGKTHVASVFDFQRIENKVEKAFAALEEKERQYKDHPLGFDPSSFEDFIFDTVFGELYPAFAKEKVADVDVIRLLRCIARESFRYFTSYMEIKTFRQRLEEGSLTAEEFMMHIQN